MRKRSTKLKWMAIWLAVVIAAGYWPVSVAAITTSTPYIDENGTARTAVATVLDNATTELTGWYVVDGHVNTTNLTVRGHTSIILKDGSSLTVGATGDNAAIVLPFGYSLTLYGQALGTGTLSATGSGKGAGIGGSGGADSNTFGAGQAAQNGGHGGAVTVSGGHVAASRIGGGQGGDAIHSTSTMGNGGAGGNSDIVTVKRGTLTVAGRIGGGDGGESIYHTGGNGGNLLGFKVLGGTVTAGSIEGGNGGDGDYVYAPLGGGPMVVQGIAGDGGNSGIVQISGGTVSISGDIGGGNAGSSYPSSVNDPATGGDGSVITLSGGTVRVSGVIGGGDGTTWRMSSHGGNGSCVITGGSFNPALLRPIPTNGSANGYQSVHLTGVTMNGVSTSTEVRHLLVESDYPYGSRDMFTNATGKVMLWVPEGVNVTQAYTTGTIFAGTVAAGTVGTLSPATPDVVRPSVVAVSIADGATNIPTHGSISITFSEVMSDVPGTVAFLPTVGSPVVLTGGSWKSDNNVFTLSYSGLAEGATYTIDVSGFTDFSGNEMEIVASRNFQVVPPVIIPVFEIPYIDEAGTTKTASALKIDSTTHTLTTGWYVAEGNISLTNLNISGTARLILMDGCTLSVAGTDYHAAVRVVSGNTLVLYGQAGGTGTLQATAGGRGAGIGGNGGNGSDGESCGTFAVYGGIVIANRIGGGDGSLANFSNYHGGSGGVITFYGGTTSVSGRIGGGNGGDGFPHTISGGNGGVGSTLGIHGGNVSVAGKIGGGAAGSGSSVLGLTGSAGGAGSCTITGGSAKLSTLQPVPRNGSANGNLVVSHTTMTLGGVTSPREIKALVTSASFTYGTRDMKTDAVGKLYLWLPADTNATAAFAQDGLYYAGSVPAGGAGTLVLSTASSEEPVITSMLPSEGDVNVPVNGSITITFSNVMDVWSGHVMLSTGGSDPIIPTGGVWTNNGTVCTIPYSGLTYITVYTFTLSGFEDAMGRAVHDDSVTFSTTTRPKSVVVGTQTGRLIEGTPGSVTVEVATVSIERDTPITLDNTASVAGILLDTPVTEGDRTTVVIRTSEETPSGSHPLALTIDGVTSNVFHLVVDEAVFGISLSQTAPHVFPVHEMGYDPVEGLSVTITNTGNAPTGSMDITLTGAGSAGFSLSIAEMQTLAVGANYSFSVSPSSGLPIGNYVATVTVSGPNIDSQMFVVEFAVTERTGYSVLSVTTPATAIIRGTNIIANVGIDVVDLPIVLSLSPGASWKLFSDLSCTDEIEDKSLVLSIGANIAFIQVTAEDGSKNLYALAIARMNVQSENEGEEVLEGTLGQGAPPDVSGDGIPDTGENDSWGLLAIGLLGLSGIGLLWLRRRIRKAGGW